MKLCTICDKKIEGTWCKTCRRFVKTYDLPSGVYLNERHDPLDDKNCTYHTEPTKTVVRGNTGTGTQRTYTSASASGTSRPVAKKKGKKTALVAVIGYLIILCFGTIGPSILKFADDVSEGFHEVNFDDEQYYDDEEAKLSQEEQQELLDQKNRNAMLMELEPAFVVEEEDYEIRYFTSEDIEGVGYSCDDRHLDMDLDEFEKWLLSNAVNGFQFSDSSSRFSNYYYISDDYSQASFTCFRDYDGFGDFSIRADYDTATKQLHIVRFETNGDGMNMSYCVSLAKAFDSDTEWSKEQFVKDVEEAKKVGDYATLYYSEKVHIAFEMNGEGYSLIYYPVY